jgi:hypothetical protein
MISLPLMAEFSERQSLRNHLQACDNQETNEILKLDGCDKLTASGVEFNKEFKLQMDKNDEEDRAYHLEHPYQDDELKNNEVLVIKNNKVRGRTQALLAIYDKYCKQYPQESTYCFTPEEVAAEEDKAMMYTCSNHRGSQLYKTIKELEKAKEADFQLVSTHTDEWAALPSPKDCNTLLKKDLAKFEKGNQPSKPEISYKSDTCEWVTDLPRKVIAGPGCKTGSSNKICTGHVSCEQKTGEGRFIRLSSCSPEHCGASKEDAVSCTKQLGFISEKAPDEILNGPSDRVKSALGVTGQ